MKHAPKIGSVLKRPKISAGDIYMVTDKLLNEVGLCVVTQATRGPIQIGYFFDSKKTKLCDIISNKEAVFLDAVLVAQFGYIGIRDGHWRLLGHIENYTVGDWPIAVGVWGQGGLPPYYACYFEPKTLKGWTQVPLRDLNLSESQIILISTDLYGHIAIANYLKISIDTDRNAFRQCDFR